VRVAVIGAGIVGITTAYELAADGHEVTVYERRGAAAEEASFANAGVVAPGSVTPWAAPGMPAKVLGNLLGRHAAVKLSLPLSGRDLAWMWKWWRACKLETYLANRARMQRLAFYSRERLHHLTAELQLEYDRADGYTVLLRSEKDNRIVQPGLAVLRDAGVAFSELSEEGVRKIEPAINPDTAFSGGIHLPQDEVANCRQFALLLKDVVRNMGVTFYFNTAIDQLNRAQAAINLAVSNIHGQHGEHSFDAVVVCAGVAASELLKPLGLHIPTTAVYGYSISAPIKEPLNAPRSALMDEHYKVAISRLGNRIRVAGGAELGGSLARHRASSIQTLYKVLSDWFPGAAQLANTRASVQVWKGARPMLPDGPPIIGPSGIAGVWLNLGHGSSGWALSCGSARALADLVAGRPADIDMGGFDAGRLT
jgi:D-amino-acid dehydrogenase